MFPIDDLAESEYDRDPNNPATIRGEMTPFPVRDGLSSERRSRLREVASERDDEMSKAERQFMEIEKRTKPDLRALAAEAPHVAAVAKAELRDAEDGQRALQVTIAHERGYFGPGREQAFRVD